MSRRSARSAPATVERQVLRRAQGAIETEQGEFGVGVAFHPESTWMATGHVHSVSLWPLSRRYPTVFRLRGLTVNRVTFSSDGENFVIGSEDGTIRVWPVHRKAGEEPGVLYSAEGSWEMPLSSALSPDGSFLAIGTYNGTVKVLPLDGGPVRELAGPADFVRCIAVDPLSRFVAVGLVGEIEPTIPLRLWDLETDDVRVLDAGDDRGISACEFTSGGDLLVDSGPYVRRWNLGGEEPRVVDQCRQAQ